MATFDDPLVLFDDPGVLFDSGASGGGGIFICPSDDIVPPIYVTDDPYFPSSMNPLMRHYRNQTRGRNIFLMSDGTVIDSQLQFTPPNMIQPPTDPYVRSIFEQGGALVEVDTFQVPYVTATMYGGSANPVTADQKAQLEAAGYTVS